MLSIILLAGAAAALFAAFRWALRLSRRADIEDRQENIRWTEEDYEDVKAFQAQHKDSDKKEESVNDFIRPRRQAGRRAK